MKWIVVAVHTIHGVQKKSQPMEKHVADAALKAINKRNNNPHVIVGVQPAQKGE